MSLVFPDCMEPLYLYNSPRRPSDHQTLPAHPYTSGIEKGDGDYVLSRRPDYILFGSSIGSSAPIFLSDVELFASETFWRHYRLARHRVDDDTQLLLYERLKTPRSEPLSAQARREIDRVVAQAMERSRFRY